MDADARNCEWLLIRGRELGDAGDQDGAIRELTKYVELRPDDFRGFAVRALNHKIAGRYGDAFEDFSRAIELAPDNASLYAWRWALNVEIGDLDAAAADLEKGRSLLGHE